MSASFMDSIEMSQDICTPLHIILGCDDMAANHYYDKELVLRYLESIRISGEYLLKSIDCISQVMNRIQDGADGTCFDYRGKLENHTLVDLANVLGVTADILLAKSLCSAPPSLRNEYASVLEECSHTNRRFCWVSLFRSNPRCGPTVFCFTNAIRNCRKLIGKARKKEYTVR